MLGFGKFRSAYPVLSYADGIAVAWQDFLMLAARIMVGLIYLTSGWGKVTGLTGFVGNMERQGVPTVLAYIGPFLEFLAGLALILGFATRYAAIALIIFTVAATWISHRYWLYPAEQMRAQQTQFWKNVAMIGGQLAIFVAGPGRFSLDRWLSRR